MKRIALLLLFCATLSFNCRKPVHEKYPEYAGYWLGYTSEYGDAQTIRIDDTGWGKYYSSKAGKGFSGKARANERSLSIGGHKFNVEEEPHVADTATDQLSRNFYRYRPAVTCPLMRMRLNTPPFWGNASLNFYRVE